MPRKNAEISGDLREFPENSEDVSFVDVYDPTVLATFTVKGGTDLTALFDSVNSLVTMAVIVFRENMVTIENKVELASFMRISLYAHNFEEYYRRLDYADDDSVNYASVPVRTEHLIRVFKKNTLASDIFRLTLRADSDFEIEVSHKTGVKSTYKIPTSAQEKFNVNLSPITFQKIFVFSAPLFNLMVDDIKSFGKRLMIDIDGDECTLSSNNDEPYTVTKTVPEDEGRYFSVIVDEMEDTPFHLNEKITTVMAAKKFAAKSETMFIGLSDTSSKIRIRFRKGTVGDFDIYLES